ncbi:hypothetical protein HY993_05065 [Candidatus Micrarchaeota archaeon]|nr:hypothetical protein [Candidatus Micrarchaeota archaeon]
MAAVIAFSGFAQAEGAAVSLQVIDVSLGKALSGQSVLEIAPATVLIKAANSDASSAGRVTVVFEGRETVFEYAFKDVFEKEIILPRKGSYEVKAVSEKLLQVQDERVLRISVLNESVLGKYVPSEIILLVVVGVVITLVLLLSTLARQAGGNNGK